MESRSTIIPSKNALRALRRLAFSGPTLLAGAVGSACGIATIECEARRRIRLAEQIINTKQTIRSISNGRSANHLAQMFEAAERGEDFTLDPTKTHKRRRVRNYSALAVQQEQDFEEVDGLQQWMQERNKNDKSMRENQYNWGVTARDDAGSYLQIKYRPRNTGTASRDGPNPSRFQNRAAEDKMSLSKGVSNKSLNEIGQEKVAISKLENKGWVNLSSHNSSVLDVQHSVDSPMVQSKTPVKAIDEMTRHGRRFIGLDRLPPESPDDLGSLQTPLLTASEISSVRLVSILPASTSVTSNDVTSQSDTSQQEDTASTLQSSAARNLENNKEETTFSNFMVDWQPYYDITIPSDIKILMQSLSQVADNDKLKSARKHIASIKSTKLRRETWIQYMRDHAASNAEIDSTTAEVLFHEYYPSLGLDKSPQPARMLAKRLLSEDPLSSRAAAILFPYQLRSRQNTDHKRPYRTAYQYLLEFNQDVSDSNAQVHESHKLLSLAISKGIEPSEYLVEPAIRSLCSIGAAQVAEDLLRETELKYGIKFTTFTLSVLVKGLARAGLWANINNVMEDLYKTGIIRTHPVGCSLLFHNAFQCYLEQKSVDEALRYLMGAITDWRIKPTPTISAALVSACLRSGRYEVVQDWVQYYRSNFLPDTATTKTSAFAWEIGKTWQDMDATCEDIERGCQAMAFEAVSDSFSKVIRGIATEAIKRDLHQRLPIVRNSLCPEADIHQAEVEPPTSLNSLFRAAYDIVSRCPAMEKLGSEQQVVLRDFMKQIKAITRLEQWFGGEYVESKFDDTFIFETTRQMLRQNEQKNNKPAILDSLPNDLTQEVLPLWPELLRSVQLHYSSRQEQGLQVSHEILRYLTSKLASCHREFHAGQLLDYMYNSSYVHGRNGVPFNTDIFSDWLKLAYSLKSPSRMTKVLWAVVDSGNGVQLSTLFLLLVRLAALEAPTIAEPEYHRNDNGLLPAQSVAKELEYLQNRLKKRAWISSGRPANSAKMPSYRTWEDQMRETISQETV